jgi:hypothetical protein
MIEITEDIFCPNTYRNLDGSLSNIVPYAICVTTNGYVKKNGRCAMGRGIALQAKKKYPNLPYRLGERILSSGNQVYHFSMALEEEFNIITFPVKPAFSICCTDKSNAVEH